jgi:cell division protein FtsA
MNKDVAVGIDIGTHQIKVVIAESSSLSQSMPTILGAGYAESKGLRHGYIINQHDAIRSVRKAIRQAERSAKMKIKRVFVSIGGIGLSSITSEGIIMVSRADNEITELDLEKAVDEAQRAISQPISVNKKMIHTIPISYKVDGKEILGHNPVGMKGVKLQAKVLFVMCLEHHLSELIQVIEEAGVEITDVMAAPLAASLVSLSKAEKIAGVVLTNIGSETVSVVVYEDDIPISLEVFPVGSNDITNDIALGLQVSLDEAESIKRAPKQRQFDTVKEKKKLEDIIGGRMSDIFDLINSHLKKINKSGMLPAGIVITGGGSSITTIEDIAKAYLKLPSKVSKLVCDNEIAECISGDSVSIKEGSWAVAYGLCVFGLHADGEGIVTSGINKTFLKPLLRSIMNFFKQLLP